MSFIFSQGADAALRGNISWINDVWDIAVYETPLTATQNMTWADVIGFVLDRKTLQNRTITSFGGAASDPVEFTSVSPSPNQLIKAAVIVRQSDNLVLAHIDTAFQGIPSDQALAGEPIPPIGSGDLSYTFTLRTSLNNERAWFRL